MENNHKNIGAMADTTLIVHPKISFLVGVIQIYQPKNSLIKLLIKWESLLLKLKDYQVL